ncbi:MAG: N-acetylmuramoyl-L-alanine amidase LytC [Firmicutes bacterium]|nr:N-acetylmuramoyl-L-alanine amidase LytC [candidate division NPL-UPA2 bacterium]
MQKRIAIWLAFMMLTVFVSSAWAATPSVVNVNQLNLRSGPGQSFRVLGTLARNTELVVVGLSGDWRQVVTSTGNAGWVFGQHLVEDSRLATTARAVAVDVARLNVRQGPGTGYPVVAVAERGQSLRVMGNVGEWLKVQTALLQGYVRSDFVTEENTAPAKPHATGVPLARVTASILNVRAGTGTQFPVITQLAQGTLVAILTPGAWSQVMLENGTIGFVSEDYIARVAGAATARVDANAVNQRRGPGTSFPVMTTHPAGQVVSFGGREGDWVRVSSAAGEGFILGSFLSFGFLSPEVPTRAEPVKRDLVGFKVAIDAGHGGSDPGAIGVNGLRESDVNLRMALKLRTLLQDAGAEVFMTRTSDVRLTLDERIAVAHDNRADVFVSIHNNAHPLTEVSGTKTFFGITPSSFRLGQAVHRHLATLGIEDRGMHSANFRVLQATTVPAILTETAFLSNHRDAALLADESFINRAVEAHFEGIREFLRGRSGL